MIAHPPRRSILRVANLDDAVTHRIFPSLLRRYVVLECGHARPSRRRRGGVECMRCHQEQRRAPKPPAGVPASLGHVFNLRVLEPRCLYCRAPEGDTSACAERPAPVQNKGGRPRKVQ